MFELVFLTGARAGQVVPVNRSLIAGRSPDCPLVVPDLNVSRQHCRFELDGGGVTLVDNNSSNGTYLNEERVEEPIALKQDDVVRLGQTRLRFVIQKKIDDRSDMTSMFRETEAEPWGKSILVSVSEVGKRTLSQKALSTRLDAIIRVSKALVNIRDSERISQDILDALFDVFPQADRGFLMLGSDAASLVPEAVKRRRGETEEMKLSRTICRSALEKKGAILFDDGGEMDFEPGVSIAALQIRSAMVVPLIVDDQVLGLLQIDTPDRRAAFTEADLELAVAVSQQAAIALHNAQLLRKVESEAVTRENLMRFLPGAMVEQVLSGQLDLALGGRTCRGTVLFSDVVGFTSLSERLDPEQVVKMMNDYFSRMVPCIEQAVGAVDKFMGDAIMAVWGVPIDRPGSTFRAASAALAMQNALIGFNSLQVSTGWPALDTGIGLNTGMVVAGNIGSDNRVSYTVLGDTVNAAQRLEASAGRGQILISESSWRDMPGSAFGILMPPLKVKNKAEPLYCYSLRGMTALDGEIVLHLPLTCAGLPDRPVFLIRRLTDSSFIALHPEDVEIELAQLVTDIKEWPGVRLGYPSIEAVLPRLASDGLYVRSQIRLEDPSLEGLLSKAAVPCGRAWEEMIRG